MTLRETVFEALNNAVENDYVIDLDKPETEAQTLIDLCADFENCTIAELVPFILEWGGR